LARLRPEPYTTALTLVLGFLKPTTDPSLIGHIVGANDVHDVPLLVSDFHAEVGFVQFWVVIQKLSRDKRRLLDRASDTRRPATTSSRRTHERSSGASQGTFNG
jgi:hypothetical protein